MKWISSLILLLALTFSNSINAQTEQEVKTGDLLKIGSSQNFQYNHVKFPRPNFIIKSGGVANYKHLAGIIVEVTEVKNNRNDETIIMLKRKDDKKFFDSFPVVRANYSNAIASGELTKIKSPD